MRTCLKSTRDYENVPKNKRFNKYYNAILQQGLLQTSESGPLIVNKAGKNISLKNNIKINVVLHN
jgi:hypothetical protein